MPCTQLACPHCGSTLNFGTEITTGTPVECLICMQTFHATNPVTSAAPSKPHIPVQTIDTADMLTLSDATTDTMPKAAPAVEQAEPAHAAELMVVAPVEEAKPAPAEVMVGAPVEKAKRPPAADVMIAKPYAAPTAPQPDTAVPTAPSIRKPAADSSNSMALIVVGIGLIFLLSGGIALAVWKLTTTTGLAPCEIAGLDPNKKVIPATDDGGGTPLVKSDEDDDDIRAKFQEEVKQVLKRKAPVQGGLEPEWDGFSSGDFQKQGITGLDQKKINLAIERGVAYLKKTQHPNGTWSNGHAVGHAAIGGLTLLECNTPTKHPTVQRAALYVRANCVNLSATYELSLAILFLDRLGEPRDRPLIQGMAMRLIAGQNDAGGWSYNCNVLPPQDMYQLFTFLQTKKQLLDPVGVTKGDPLKNPVHDPKMALNDPFQQLNDLILAKGIAGAGDSPDPKVDPKNPAVKPKTPVTKPIRPDMLNPNLKNLPIVQNKGKGKGKVVVKRNGGGDNSNTQFAMLALWAARRNGVPSDLALLAGYQRFNNSQNGDNGWGYQVGSGSTNTMTCVGLLGLGIGHGTAPEILGVDPDDPKVVVVKPALQDPKIQAGLQTLARNIGQPSLDPKKSSFPMQNLYFLWSVERVAMLYDLKTVGGKDWYGWGAQILVHNQDAGGAWSHSSYYGANPPLNTCFALLFLRRSNLVRDLTNNLRLNTGVREPN